MDDETRKEDDLRRIRDAFELAWGRVFTITNHFLAQHDQFGFKLIQEMSNPRIEDMLFALRVMDSILNTLDGQMSVEDQRMLLNAKQQIVLFSRVTLAVQRGDEQEYGDAVRAMQNQAQI